MGMLSAFETAKLNLRLELKWAQLCSLLTVLLQPKVLHTTAESADTLNNVVMGRNHSAKELLTYIYLLLCFFFLFFKLTLIFQPILLRPVDS